ncbi:MAG TPA: nucleotidyltransferase domain-containing protein [Desulfohalobiaceae bacterium]|nr:nucleotidyltransferase domain-containing protein [Desulfohalobiaceae bacterium]
MNIQTISQMLEEMPEILLAIVYGSAARERLTDKSDIDIAVAGNTAINYERMTEIANILSERAGKEVDLVDLRQVSGPILLEILDKGRVILKKSIPVYAEILRKLWYNQADMMPYTNMIMQKQLDRFFHE